MMHLKTITGLALALFILAGCQQKPKQNESQKEQTIPHDEQKSEEVSDKELQLFATIQQKANSLHQQSHKEKVNTVENLGLSVERFNEIEQSQQDPNKETDATQEELQNFQEAIQLLEQIQAQDQEKMLELVEDEGLTVNRYQEIE
ncbi:MAG: hypothetical protein ACOCWW_03135, partial [Bacteroidota bacterium]